MSGLVESLLLTHLTLNDDHVESRDVASTAERAVAIESAVVAEPVDVAVTKSVKSSPAKSSPAKPSPAKPAKKRPSRAKLKHIDLGAAPSTVAPVAAVEKSISTSRSTFSSCIPVPPSIKLSLKADRDAVVPLPRGVESPNPSVAVDPADIFTF